MPRDNRPPPKKNVASSRKARDAIERARRSVAEEAARAAHQAAVNTPPLLAQLRTLRAQFMRYIAVTMQRSGIVSEDRDEHSSFVSTFGFPNLAWEEAVGSGNAEQGIRYAGSALVQASQRAFRGPPRITYGNPLYAPPNDVALVQSLLADVNLDRTTRNQIASFNDFMDRASFTTSGMAILNGITSRLQQLLARIRHYNPTWTAADILRAM